MKTLKSVFMLVLIIVVIGVCVSCKQQGKGAVSIGVIIPLTGDYAKIGLDIKKAIEIAEQDAINKGFAKKGEITVYFEDNKLDAALTVAAYNKLKSINNIQAVITVTSKCILALKPLANKDKVLLLNASAISTEIEDAEDFCFSLIPNARTESEYLSDYMLKKKQIKNAALIYRNDQSGQSFNSCFAKKYTQDGGVIGITESHPVNTSDFRTIIAKLKQNKDIQGIFAASLGVEVANFVKQCKELNYKLPILTYESINQPNALDIAGNLIDDIEFVSPKFLKSDPDYDLFKKSLKEKFNSEEINFYMISHYNAYMVIAKLLKSGFTTGTEFRDNVAKIRNYKFLGPEIIIDPQGNASTALGIFGFKNKQLINISE